MNDIDAIEAAQNKQLNDYLDGFRSGEENWIAAESYMYNEVLEIQETLQNIIKNAKCNFNLANSDIKEMLIDAIKDLV